MNQVIDLFIRRPVFASMIILAMVVVGSAAYMALGVDRLPSVDLPSINVRTTLPGASPEEVESEVSETIEEVVNTVDGIEELRSISSNGTSFVIATFRLDRDIDTAAQDVRDKVATVARRLPEEADPPTVSKFDNDSSPVITFALSGELSLRELTEIADKTVKPLLERSKSVGEVRINGGAERTINIDVDADKLVAYRIPITAVRDAIVRQNSEVPGGNLTGGGVEQSLRTLGRIDDPADFEQVVVAEINGSPVRVGDVAKVTDGTAERRSSARLNGQPSVSVEILRQSGANTIEVIEAVKENARRLDGSLPPGVKFEVIRDQSRYIYIALHEINTHLVMGSILASLVVFAFTRSWRSTVIAAVAIPTSVVSTFAVMWLMGFTLNSVTMLALVLMVGIVIDDAIVVLENIFRFVEEKGVTPFEAARQGTAEIATAVLATTLSLAIIFVPVSFMSSISGRFLYQFGITAAVAVLVSLVVSFVLTPTLSARMLGAEAKKKHGENSGSRGGFYRHIDRGYTWMLVGAMRARFFIAIVAVAIIASAWPLFKLVPQGFLPQGADEAEFEIRVNGPEGASYAAMDLVMQQVERDLRAMPEIRTILATSGGGFIGGVNQGEVYVRIAPHEERVLSLTRIVKSLLNGDPKAAWRGNYTQTDVMQKVRATMRKYQSRDMTISVRNYPSFNLGGGNFDIDFSLAGPDLNELSRYSQELVERAKKIGGIINVDSTLKLTKPELRVQIDRERAFDLGVSSQEIGTALRLMVGGDLEISRYRDPQTNENYDVRLRLGEQFRNQPDKIPELLLSGGENKTVELRNLASLEPALSAARIDRTDRSRDSRVRGTIAPGYALADRTEALLAEAAAMGMPPAYTVTVRGAGKEFAKTYREFVFALILSVVFMYMILASQYEHLIHPVTILLSLPVAIPFALLSLYMANEQLNLYSALGILVLFGVVKKNAILQIDHVNQLREKGMPRYEAIIQGNRDRLRPILMTTLSLVAGMLPLWLGTGPGAEERRAVAIVVIGGQMLSLLVTLLVTPVAYSILDDMGALVRRRRGGAREVQVEAPVSMAPAAK